MMAGCAPVMWPMADSAAAAPEGTNLTTRETPRWREGRDVSGRTIGGLIGGAHNSAVAS
jgi:hypothetical protein